MSLGWAVYFHITRVTSFTCAGLMLQVMYHPQQHSVFISGSMDGLINIADFSEGLDEDDSFKVSQSAAMSFMAFLHASDLQRSSAFRLE